MIHGPCGDANPTSVCMADNHCTKHFPRQFANKTHIDENGYPIYKRRDNCRAVEKNGVLLENRYNLLKYY